MQKSKSDPQKHHRRSIRVQGFDYSSEGAYFVTIVTHRRECLFGEVVNKEMRLNDLGSIADECWRAIPEHFPNVELGAHVVMPNHMHGIIFITDDGTGTMSIGARRAIGVRTGTMPVGARHTIDIRRGTIYRCPYGKH